LKRKIKNLKILDELKKQKIKILCFELDGLVTGHVILCICNQDERKVHSQTHNVRVILHWGAFA